ncbi:MAG TPA: non-heme iron oxygenase ferredoxin subunit [Steroidobacteraceae bacterium]|nr:non-heme iron oxygenase ferredoxin subunit [Steroidobacteraceae bacterium]
MASQWVDVGEASAVAAGEPFPVEIDGIPVVVVRCGDRYYAVEDRCTHDGEPLAGAEVDAQSCEIVCPRHGARFCLRTGEALTPPAYEPVRTFTVRVERGRLAVELPE